MSEHGKVDATQTLINYEDTPTLPPPRLEVGAIAWIRKNLFGSPLDVIITILSTLFIVTIVYTFFDWAIGWANWYAILNNQRLFMMDRMEPLYEWRVALTVLIAALLTGISLSIWVRRSARTMSTIALILIVAMAIVPTIIQSTLAPPPSYFAAGNVDIVDRADTILPQGDLAFIAQAGETVSIAMTDTEVVSDKSLGGLAGFSDRTASALANAAQSRLDRQAEIGKIFDDMLAKTMTDELQERTRQAIRPFIRNNDMSASMLALASEIENGLDNFNLFSFTKLELFLERLELAVKSVDDEQVKASTSALRVLVSEIENLLTADVRAQAGSAVLSSLNPESIEDSALASTISQLVEKLEALDAATRDLVAAIQASENAEALGEQIVNDLSDDLIGEPDVPQRNESLITPTREQAAILRDIYVLLLTPQSISETYDISETPIRVAILDGLTMQTLVSGTVSQGSEPVIAQIPADGWYVFEKAPLEDEDGTAILRVDGIYPIVERSVGINSSIFTRLTDEDLFVTADRPQVDGEEIPFVALIDNQFRGKRSLSAYLVHFIPMTFEQFERLFFPFILTVVWGYVIGRILSHIAGEQSRFKDTRSRIVLSLIALTPLLLILLYFGPVNGDFGFSRMEGFPAAIFKIAIASLLFVLAGQIESWLNRTNRGLDSEGSITNSLLYMWGIFPIAMYVLASGIGGLSGAALGSMVGGVVWLIVMYFVGMNFRGLFGYGLFIGAIFLQFLQAFIVEAGWTAGVWHQGDIIWIGVWLVLAIVGVALAYFASTIRQALDVNFLRVLLIAGLALWLSALAFTPITINALRSDETIAELVSDTRASLPADFVSTYAVRNDNDFIAHINEAVAELELSDEVRAPLLELKQMEMMVKTTNRVAALVGWLMLMFVIGAAFWSSNWLFVGLSLMTFHWYLYFVQIDVWSSLYFIMWLAVGILIFNRGLERGRDERKKLELGAGSRLQRYALPALIISVVAWLAVLFIIPMAVVAFDNAGILQTSPNELLPLTDKRRWGGLMLTMQLTILGIIASFPLGLALALGRRSNLPIVKTACIVYIETVRGVPLITVLFMAQLLVPLVDPALATVEGVIRVLIGVTMFSAAYLAENVRGGLQSIPKGQTEAAQAIGLSGWHTTLYILLPQALRAVIPALVGQFISLFKDTSLVVIVALAELTGVAQRVVNQPEFLQRRQETFLYIAIIYFAFSYIMAYISRRVEETGSGAARARQI